MSDKYILFCVRFRRIHSTEGEKIKMAIATRKSSFIQEAWIFLIVSNSRMLFIVIMLHIYIVYFYNERNVHLKPISIVIRFKFQEELKRIQLNYILCTCKSICLKNRSYTRHLGFGLHATRTCCYSTSIICVMWLVFEGNAQTISNNTSKWNDMIRLHVLALFAKNLIK